MHYIYEDCINQLKGVCVANLSAIVLYSESWHSGVLGIICAKLTEKFNRPVCLLTKVDNVYKGSIRSLGGIDIFKELSKVSSLLVKFGGHSGAGGLTIEEKNITKFIEQLNRNIAETYTIDAFDVVKYYDFDLNKDTVDIDFVKELEQLEPFGFGNEKPVFKYTFNNLKPERLKNYPNFIKFKAENFEMISFNLSEYFESFNTNCNKNVLLDLAVETFNKKEKLKAVIKNINFEKLNTSIKTEVCLGYYAKQLNTPKFGYNFDVKEIDTAELKELLENPFGTLIVANDFNAHFFCFFKRQSFGFTHFVKLIGELSKQRRLEVIKTFEFPFGDTGFGAGISDFFLGSQNHDFGSDFVFHRHIGGDHHAGILTFRQHDAAGNGTGAFSKFFNSRHFECSFYKMFFTWPPVSECGGRSSILHQSASR